MELITTNSALEANLSRLIEQYQNIAFSVAWASAGNNVFKLLEKRKSKINKAVVGIHFYQTDPCVLHKFIRSSKLRFMLQPSGVFHPKLYAFWGGKNWEILIGSANLTNGALRKNSEVMVLITNRDQNDSNLLVNTLTLIEEYWNDAKSINKNDALNYSRMKKRNDIYLRKVKGQYGEFERQISPIESEFMTMKWSKFFKKIKNSKDNNLDERLSLLNLSKNSFKSYEEFSEMEINLRKAIAGLPNQNYKNWGWFGSMVGAGFYHQAINNNNIYISKALAKIPIVGPVSKENFEKYCDIFVKAFPNGGVGVALASRLLALKRPDYFVCLDSRNRRDLCKEFGIRSSGMTYERYWDEIIDRIIDSVWWNESRPKEGISGAVWDGRAAMLDVIFYSENK